MNNYKQPKVFVILVVYYKNYVTSAINEIKKLLRIINKEYILLVVSNNPDLSCDIADNILYSDNSFWEFSAWDQGFFWIEKEYAIESNDWFIFCNDTFCNHRIFTYIDRYLFIKKISRLSDNPLSLVGECSTFKEKFQIDGVTSTHWISSYLFSTTYRGVKKIKPFVDERCSFVAVDKGFDKIYLPGFSKNMIQHLNDWLFPAAENEGWYKSKSRINKNVLKSKLVAIYNEKMLTVKALKEGVLLIDVYDGFFAHTYKRIARKIYNIIHR